MVTQDIVPGELLMVLPALAFLEGEMGEVPEVVSGLLWLTLSNSLQPKWLGTRVKLVAVLFTPEPVRQAYLLHLYACMQEELHLAMLEDGLSPAQVSSGLLLVLGRRGRLTLYTLNSW